MTKQKKDSGNNESEEEVGCQLQAVLKNGDMKTAPFYWQDG